VPSEFVLTPDEAAVIRAAPDYESPYYELATVTRLTPSRVRDIVKNLAKKNLAESSSSTAVLTPDGQTVRRILAGTARGSTFGRVHIVDQYDPHKGRWGGQPTDNGRELRATVRPAEDDLDRIWFDVDLEVRSTDPVNRPLVGVVTFFLHPSFSPDVRTATPVDNAAVLTLRSLGAFTVGAVADDGATRLELDLAELPSAPEAFRAL
jgi:hypothetical protein